MFGDVLGDSYDVNNTIPILAHNFTSSVQYSVSCDSDRPCLTHNCGREAGCVCDPRTGLPRCVCPDTLLPPDKHLRCVTYRLPQPPAQRHFPRIKNIPKFPSNSSGVLPRGRQSDPQDRSKMAGNSNQSPPRQNHANCENIRERCHRFPCPEGSGCVCNPETFKLQCICAHNRKPPMDGKCSAGYGRAVENEVCSDVRQRCLSYNCGEAGCFCNPTTGRLECRCEQTMKPPVNGKCPYIPGGNIVNGSIPRGPTIDINRTVVVLPPPVPPKLSVNKAPLPATLTTEQTSSMEQNLSNNDNIWRTVRIAAPVSAVALLLILSVIFIVMCRRQKSRAAKKKSRTSSSQAITWIHKQDQVHLLENLAVVGKNPHYLGSDAISAQLNSIHTTYIPRSCLKLMTVIGEGAFGKVFKGEVEWGEKNISSLVAVKILKEDASRETREDFTREVKIVSSFTHDNILKLMGVVAIENECPYMVFEYMEHGDLTELLRSNDPSSIRRAPIHLRQPDLVDIATQIANGMMYLASKHFVHRDLATRNCLVGSELIVKISDFGMSRDIYTCDYYKVMGGNRMLPVRWMSPESVKYGRFTPESDVWSYGVVLWEIFSFGKQPHFGHSNEEVIRFIDDGILLQRPKKCPDTVYHIMLGCWRKDTKDRFTFERIHRHLLDYNRKMVKCYHQHSLPDDVTLTVEQV